MLGCKIAWWMRCKLRMKRHPMVVCDPGTAMLAIQHVHTHTSAAPRLLHTPDASRHWALNVRAARAWSSVPVSATLSRWARAAAWLATDRSWAGCSVWHGVGNGRVPTLNQHSTYPIPKRVEELLKAQACMEKQKALHAVVVGQHLQTMLDRSKDVESWNQQLLEAFTTLGVPAEEHAAVAGMYLKLAADLGPLLETSVDQLTQLSVQDMLAGGQDSGAAAVAAIEAP